MLRCTWANSFLRRTPLFTKTQVRRSPMARSTRTAATEESTPPERAADGMAFAHLFANGSDRGLNELGWGPVGLGVADAEEEVAQQFGAARSVAHLGVKLHRPDVALRIGNAGDGVGGFARSAKNREAVPAPRRRGTSTHPALRADQRRAGCHRVGVRHGPDRTRACRQSALFRRGGG